MANSLKKTFCRFFFFFFRSSLLVIKVTVRASVHVRARVVDARRCGSDKLQSPGCDSASRFASAYPLDAPASALRAAYAEPPALFGVPEGPQAPSAPLRASLAACAAASAARDTPETVAAASPRSVSLGFPSETTHSPFGGTGTPLSGPPVQEFRGGGERANVRAFTRRLAGAGAGAEPRDDGVAARSRRPRPPRTAPRRRARPCTTGSDGARCAPDRGTRAGFVRGVGFVRARKRAPRRRRGERKRARRANPRTRQHSARRPTARLNLRPMVTDAKRTGSARNPRASRSAPCTPTHDHTASLSLHVSTRPRVDVPGGTAATGPATGAGRRRASSSLSSGRDSLGSRFHRNASWPSATDPNELCFLSCSSSAGSRPDRAGSSNGPSVSSKVSLAPRAHRFTVALPHGADDAYRWNEISGRTRQLTGASEAASSGTGSRTSHSSSSTATGGSWRFRVSPPRLTSSASRERRRAERSARTENASSPAAPAPRRGSP